MSIPPQQECIEAGEDPLRYEYGRPNDDPGSPSITDQTAYVEEENFHWETYGSHEKDAKPSREEAQQAAIKTLRNEGRL